MWNVSDIFPCLCGMFLARLFYKPRLEACWPCALLQIYQQRNKQKRSQYCEAISENIRFPKNHNINE